MVLNFIDCGMQQKTNLKVPGLFVTVTKYVNSIYSIGVIYKINSEGGMYYE